MSIPISPSDDMFTSELSIVVAEIPENDKPNLSDLKVESLIANVPVPLAINAVSDASIVKLSRW